MNTTRLSSKGQVIIPKSFRAAYHWETGQELAVFDVGDGILLKPKKPFLETELDEVAACLQYADEPKTLEEMENAIGEGMREKYK